jgi:hypothetical protein
MPFNFFYKEFSYKTVLDFFKNDDKIFILKLIIKYL